MSVQLPSANCITIKPFHCFVAAPSLMWNGGERWWWRLCININSSAPKAQTVNNKHRGQKWPKCGHCEAFSKCQSVKPGQSGLRHRGHCFFFLLLFHNHKVPGSDSLWLSNGSLHAPLPVDVMFAATVQRHTAHLHMSVKHGQSLVSVHF